MQSLRSVRFTLALGMLTLVSGTGVAIQGAHAAIFEDSDARRQINVLTDSAKNSQRAIFELTNSNEQLKQENARLRGKVEELGQSIEDQSSRLKEYFSDLNDRIKQNDGVIKQLSDRIKQLEPQNVSFEGITGSSQAGEKEAFERGLNEFKNGNASNAEELLTQFVNKFPSSPYWPVAQYWLAASQYVVKDYKASIASSNSLLRRYPDHPRAAEAQLNIANCLLETAKKAEAKKILEALIKKYPDNSTTDTARATLSKIK